MDINKISKTPSNYVDYNSYYGQNKSKFSSSDNNNATYIPSNINNSNINTSNNNNYANNANAAANYWKMRYSMNPSLFQRIMREDEQLIQEHIYNQKKKESII